MCTEQKHETSNKIVIGWNEHNEWLCYWYLSSLNFQISRLIEEDVACVWSGAWTFQSQVAIKGHSKCVLFLLKWIWSISVHHFIEPIQIPRKLLSHLRYICVSVNRFRLFVFWLIDKGRLKWFVLSVFVYAFVVCCCCCWNDAAAFELPCTLRMFINRIDYWK